jgi:hypothetical protein
MDALEDDLRQKARWLFRFASINHTLSYVLTILAAFASIAASLVLSLKFGPEWLSAVLAAVPAGALIVQNAVNFEDRSRWQWDKSYRTKDLLFQLRDGRDRKEIRVEYLKLNTEALGSFPRFEIARAEQRRDQQ